MKLHLLGFRPLLGTYRPNWNRKKTPEGGEMNEMTLPSKHGLHNSSPAGLRPSSLPFQL